MVYTERRNHLNILGKRIKELRLSHRMTQMQLAKRLGYQGNSLVAHWEKGSVIPSAKNLVALSDIFEVDLMKYLNNDVPIVNRDIAKIIYDNKKMSRLCLIKLLDEKGMITKENEKVVIMAVVSGKYITNLSNRFDGMEHSESHKGS